jgi:hypothetical protein
MSRGEVHTCKTEGLLLGELRYLVISGTSMCSRPETESKQKFIISIGTGLCTAVTELPIGVRSPLTLSSPDSQQLSVK